MKCLKNENGAIMVEASIYMPIVLCTVMALLYLALFNMQEYLMLYQAERVAFVAAREEAYLGYEDFGMGADNEIDFDWGDGNIPSADKISSYYQAYFDRVTSMYREVGTALSIAGVTDEDGSGYTSRFGDAARQASLIALGTVSAPEVEIDTTFWGTDITVTITHSLPIPGVIRYLGYDNEATIRMAAYSYSVNSGEFVRNVDLASDLMSYIMEKCGLSKSYDEFLNKTDEVLSAIL
ncbi:hypothetical protein [Claveliimonas bilis]|uniref:hypothetical protein n=1 Tax=Claveliimonas bilis TaxID=3028070 RepID=UPI00292EC06D|nr:hypothetical protein [Claveliimonas bilis]